MTEVRPLLPFGAPSTGPIPPQAPRPVPRPRVPAARQGERLTPRFRALDEAFASKRLAAGESPGASDPELVVVFDLANTVDDFQRSVAGVDGLEFLAELVDEDIEPDDDFHLTKDGKRVATRLKQHTLYTMMSSAQAARELVSLFHRWRANRQMTFPPGMTPLRTAFEQMVDVRPWGPADRIRETGLLERWEETLAVKGAQGVERVEVELWFRSSERLRRIAQTSVESLIVASGGAVITSLVQPEIGYHALLVDLPADQVEQVRTSGPETIELLRADTVMLMSPAEPFVVEGPEPSELAVPAQRALPTEARPRVALLDGMPAGNHPLLAGRLVIDDPDDLAAAYPVHARHHGTAMASLICHGDLSAPGAPLSSRLYVRPVMQPDEHFTSSEKIVRDELLVDLLRRSFRRMFDGDGSASPTAPSVRIVNLSLGDPARAFVRRMGPLARMVDWLAHHYNVVIVVSAGNHATPPPVDSDAVVDASSARSAMLDALRADAINRRLLAPAEAINAVTVGAVHHDAADSSIPDTALDLLDEGMPTAFSASGFGHGRSVKPEVLTSGGRQLYLRPEPGSSGSVMLQPARQGLVGPGVLAAAPGPDRAGTAFGCGTSHATALATRACDGVFTVLEGLAGDLDGRSYPDAQYHPVLAKALLVHAAAWSGMDDVLRDALGKIDRRALTEVLGYGRLDHDRIAEATRTRVCLLGAGTISDGIRHGFDLPMPGSLRATTDWRRLTVTLAWLSPVNPRSRAYRMAKLSVEPPTTRLGVTRTAADHHAAGRGTVQHEVLEGAKALAFAAGDRLVLNVDCRVPRGWDCPPVRYGLVVSVELGTSVQADVHAEVRAGLRVQDRSRADVQPRG